MRLFLKIALIGMAALVLSQAVVHSQTVPTYGNLNYRAPAARPPVVVQNPFTGNYGYGTGSTFGSLPGINWNSYGWSGSYRPWGYSPGFNNPYSPFGYAGTRYGNLGGGMGFWR